MEHLVENQLMEKTGCGKYKILNISVEVLLKMIKSTKNNIQMEGYMILQSYPIKNLKNSLTVKMLLFVLGAMVNVLKM